MKKTPGYKLLTPAETRRLRREVKQMWSTVPPQALAKARELAGVQPGKEHEFQIAAIQEIAFELGTDEVPCTAEVSQPEIEIKFWLSEVDGESSQKELCISVLAGGLPGTATERRQFQSDEQVHDWLRFVLSDLSYQLPFALRTSILHSIEESIYKGCEHFKLHNFNERKAELSERHLKIIRQRKTKALRTKKGPDKGSKWSKVTKQQIEKLPQVIRELHEQGEKTSRANAAKRVGIRGNALARAKSLDRALKRWRPGESWSEIVEAAIKKGR